MFHWGLKNQAKVNPPGVKLFGKYHGWLVAWPHGTGKQKRERRGGHNNELAVVATKEEASAKEHTCYLT